MDRDSRRHTGLTWSALTLLFLLPLFLGLAFQTDGSGNGDGAAYRRGVCYIETEGEIPLARLEWSHPGHLLTSWALTRVLAALGWARDPHYAIHLLNFLAIGLLALVLARTWFLYDPDRTRAFTAGLIVSLLPGWAWCAQEPLSDVTGHSLVALSICTLLALQARLRGNRPFLPMAFLASLLAGLAFLFRPSAGLFVPILLWLGIETLVRCQRRRWSLALALLLGGLLPIAGVYLHFLVRNGPEQLLATHLPEAVHNLGIASAFTFTGLAKDWMHLSIRGLGWLAFILACAGWLAWLLAGDWRPAEDNSDQEHRTRRPRSYRPFLLFTLGLLPYFLFLLGNAAAARFRFSLPVQLSLALGIVPLLGHLQRRFTGPWLIPGFAIVAVATLIHSFTFSYVLTSRHHFIEAGALEVSKLSRPSDLLLGHQAAPYMQLREDYRDLLAGGWGRGLARSKGARSHGIRFDAKADDRDFWNWSWRRAETEILKTQSMGGRVLYINEVGLGGFREWLALRGFREHSLITLPAETLRNRMDTSLEEMTKTLAQELIDLHVLRVEGPTARLESGSADTPRRIIAWSRAHPKQDYQIIAGTYSETQATQYLGQSVPMDSRSSSIVILESGKLDEQGEARAGIDPSARPKGEAWLLVVIDPSHTRVLARSQLYFPHPTDDQTPADKPPWVPRARELQIR